MTLPCNQPPGSCSASIPLACESCGNRIMSEYEREIHLDNAWRDLAFEGEDTPVDRLREARA